MVAMKKKIKSSVKVGAISFVVSDCIIYSLLEKAVPSVLMLLFLEVEI